MPISLQVRRGGREGEVLPVREGAITRIGRAPSNHLVLDDPRVSPTHCLLAPARDGSGLVLIDARSDHGTLVNGAPVAKGAVGVGDVIAIEPFEIHLLAAQDADDEPVAVPPEILPGASFALVHRGEPARSYPLHPGRALVIGSGPEADVCLDDPFVSGIHLLLELDAEDESRMPYLLDLHSSNGTRVNGSHVHRRYVVPGDVLAVGRTELEVRPTGPELPVADVPQVEAARTTTEIIFGPDPGATIRPEPHVPRHAHDTPVGVSAPAPAPLDARAGSAAVNYDAFFEFRDRPFQLLADPDYFFHSRCHWGAYTTLLTWLSSGPPLALLTGETGCGKSLLVACLARRLSYYRPLPVVVRPGMECSSLAHLTAAAMARAAELHGALHAEGAGTFGPWLAAIAELRRRNIMVIFLIDDASATGHGYVRNLAGLLETQPALEATRILLAGDATLGKFTEDPPLLPYIGACCHLAPLELDEVAAYVVHRLRAASGHPDVVLTRSALQLIAAYSRGIPRLVNVVTDAALFSAFRVGERRVTRELVARAIRDALGAEVPTDAA